MVGARELKDTRRTLSTKYEGLIVAHRIEAAIMESVWVCAMCSAYMLWSFSLVFFFF